MSSFFSSSPSSPLFRLTINIVSRPLPTERVPSCLLHPFASLSLPLSLSLSLCVCSCIASIFLKNPPDLEMATRGAANRGGGPATFVGSVRRWELKWEESELPSYGAVASTPGSAPRRMQLLRWVRTGELAEMRRRGKSGKRRTRDWNATIKPATTTKEKKLNLDLLNFRTQPNRGALRRRHQRRAQAPGPHPRGRRVDTELEALQRGHRSFCCCGSSCGRRRRSSSFLSCPRRRRRPRRCRRCCCER